MITTFEIEGYEYIHTVDFSDDPVILNEQKKHLKQNLEQFIAAANNKREEPELLRNPLPYTFLDLDVAYYLSKAVHEEGTLSEEQVHRESASIQAIIMDSLGGKPGSQSLVVELNKQVSQTIEFGDFFKTKKIKGCPLDPGSALMLNPVLTEDGTKLKEAIIREYEVVETYPLRRLVNPEHLVPKLHPKLVELNSSSTMPSSWLLQLLTQNPITSTMGLTVFLGGLALALLAVGLIPGGTPMLIAVGGLLCLSKLKTTAVIAGVGIGLSLFSAAATTRTLYLGLKPEPLDDDSESYQEKKQGDIAALPSLFLP